MSKFWIITISAFFIFAVVLIVLGFLIEELPSFAENLFAEAIGIAIAFALAFALIERKFLTQQDRRQKIIAPIAKSIVGEASEIGTTLIWELSTWIVSALDMDIDLEDEGIRGDWDNCIKPLLHSVNERAESLNSYEIPVEDTLSYEDYRGWIERFNHYHNRIRSRIESNLDLHEKLLELSEAFRCFEMTLVRSMWPVSIRTEVDRFHSLGHIGNALIELTGKVGSVHARL